MKTKYINALRVEHPSGLAPSYYLGDTPIFETIEEAAGNLVGRVQTNPKLAPRLQMLSCRVVTDDSVHNYEPVSSGRVIEALLWLKLIK